MDEDYFIYRDNYPESHKSVSGKEKEKKEKKKTKQNKSVSVGLWRPCNYRQNFLRYIDIPICMCIYLDIYRHTHSKAYASKRSKKYEFLLWHGFS